MVDKKVKIECLLCGGVLKIPSLSNIEQYDGLGICQKCKSEIHVKLSKGKVLKYKIVKKFYPASEPIKITEVEIVKPYGYEQRKLREGNKSKE